MTVAELIAELLKLPPDLVVVLPTWTSDPAVPLAGVKRDRNKVRLT